jgi:hypothetical protein
VDASDSLNSRLLEMLTPLGDSRAFAEAQRDGQRVSLETIAHLARRVARLEEVLEVFRDGNPPDRKGFDALQKRLANLGIEEQMAEEEPPEE